MDLIRTYQVETSRLLIRCYAPGDAAILLASINDSLEHLRPWIPWAQDKPQEIEWTAKFIRQFRGQFDLGQDAVYGIFDRTGQHFIGGTGLHNRVGNDAREIGYWIDVRHINKGYATEAVSALIKVGFEIEGLKRIEIHCAPNNTRSNNIPHKLGFRSQNNPIDPNEIIWTLCVTAYTSSLLRKTSIKAYDFLGRPINTIL